MRSKVAALVVMVAAVGGGACGSDAVADGTGTSLAEDLNGTNVSIGQAFGGDALAYTQLSGDFHVTVGLVDVGTGELTELPALPDDPIATWVAAATDGVTVAVAMAACPAGSEVITEGMDAGPECGERSSGPEHRLELLDIDNGRWRTVDAAWGTGKAARVTAIDDDRVVVDADGRWEVDLDQEMLSAAPLAEPVRVSCASDEESPMTFDSLSTPTVARLPGTDGDAGRDVVLPAPVAERLAAVTAAGRPCASDGSLLLLSGDEPEPSHVSPEDPDGESAGTGSRPTEAPRPTVGDINDAVVDLSISAPVLVDARLSGLTAQVFALLDGWCVVKDLQVVISGSGGVDAYDLDPTDQVRVTDDAVVVIRTDVIEDRPVLRDITRIDA